jgi:hypothetical protein
MLVQVHSDNGVDGDNGNLAPRVKEVLDATLIRYRQRVTRVEVHLSDTNSHKGGGDDKRCSMEARISGLKAIAVVHHASNYPDAISGAVDKLQRIISHTIGRLESRSA